MDSQNETANVEGVALTAGLERMAFAELCDLLPENVHWGDSITPQIVQEIAWAAASNEREICARLVETGPFAGTRAGDAAAIRARSNAELSRPVERSGTGSA
jgi:hypothetical protein